MVSCVSMIDALDRVASRKASIENLTSVVQLDAEPGTQTRGHARQFRLSAKIHAYFDSSSARLITKSFAVAFFFG